MKKEEGIIFRERKRWLFLALPFTFTVYTVFEEKVRIKRGFFSTTEDDCFMYKVQDVKLMRSLFERMFGLGTVVLFTSDVTHPEIKMHHIKHSHDMKDYLMDNSEEARRRRRTLHTMSIDAGDMDDEDLIDND